METIKVYLTKGDKDEWGKCEWDGYDVTGDLFVVAKNGAWVGVYPLCSIYKIVVK